MFDSQIEGRGHRVHHSQWCRISASVTVFGHIFVLAYSTVSEMLSFKMFYLDNLGQGHGVQGTRWCHLMASIKLY